MTTAVAAVVTGIFILLAFWHVCMAMGAMSGVSGAVPSVDGKPLFVPSRRSTLAVAAVLSAFALLVAAAANLVETGLPPRLLVWSCYALALGLLARAIGEFKYVGFFKRVRGSRFAVMDSLVYSPLSLALAVGVAVVAFG
jgi:hypothetical protein